MDLGVEKLAFHRWFLQPLLQSETYVCILLQLTNVFLETCFHIDGEV